MNPCLFGAMETSIFDWRVYQPLPRPVDNVPPDAAPLLLSGPLKLQGSVPSIYVFARDGNGDDGGGVVLSESNFKTGIGSVFCRASETTLSMLISVFIL